MPKPGQPLSFPKIQRPKMLFPTPILSVFTEGRGGGKGEGEKKKNHLCEESLGTVYIPPWLPKQGLKSRAHGSGLLLSLLYRAELHPEKMTRWLLESMNSLRPLWRKRIPVYASDVVKAENLFILMPTRIPLQGCKVQPQTWLRGCRALTAPHPSALWDSPLHRAGVGTIIQGRLPPSQSICAGKDGRGTKAVAMALVLWLRFSVMNQNQWTYAHSHCKRGLTGGSNPKGSRCRQRSGTLSGLASLSRWIIRESSYYYRHYLDKQIAWLWTGQYPSLFRNITTVAFFSCLFNPHNWWVLGCVFCRHLSFLLIFFKWMTSRMQVASNEQKDKHKESQFQVLRHGKMFSCMFVWVIKTFVTVLEN